MRTVVWQEWARQESDMPRSFLRAVLILGTAALVVGLSAGCEKNLVADNARTSLSSFLSGVFDEAVDKAIFPGRDDD